jgi:hypothetical protein
MDGPLRGPHGCVLRPSADKSLSHSASPPPLTTGNREFAPRLATVYAGGNDYSIAARPAAGRVPARLAGAAGRPPGNGLRRLAAAVPDHRVHDRPDPRRDRLVAEPDQPGRHDLRHPRGAAGAGFRCHVRPLRRAAGGARLADGVRHRVRVVLADAGVTGVVLCALDAGGSGRHRLDADHLVACGQSLVLPQPRARARSDAGRDEHRGHDPADADGGADPPVRLARRLRGCWRCCRSRSRCRSRWRSSASRGRRSGRRS